MVQPPDLQQTWVSAAARRPLCLLNLGFVALHLRKTEHAFALFREALILSQQAGLRQRVASALTGVGGVTGLLKDPESAAVLLGAGEALFESLGISIAPGDRPDFEQSVAAVRADLDPAVYESRAAQGRMMTMEEAITYALALHFS